MRRLKQFEALVIEDFEARVYDLPQHAHNYYEIVYIKKGCGIYHINQIAYPYQQGDIVIVSPNDAHYFKIDQSTHFVFIKFIENYFNEKEHLLSLPNNSDTPEVLMQNKLFKEGHIALSATHRQILDTIVSNLLLYKEDRDINSSPLVRHLILSIFGILIENRPNPIGIEADSGFSTEAIIEYIHQHINTPDSLKIKKIAFKFNISPTYFSKFFKRNFNLSYREYINELKISLLKKHILSSNKSMKQIAAEFGFTDESHFSHFIKNKLQLNPSQLKQKERVKKQL